MRLFVAAFVAFSFARGATVSDLVRLVRGELAAGRSDAEVAALVLPFRLSERLEDPAIEQLQSEGAGPKTVEQLEWLREASTSQPASPPMALFEPPPAPSDE